MNSISDRLSIEEHDGRQIIMVNYKGLKEKEMIDLLYKNWDLVTQTKIRIILSDFNRCYVTPEYVTHAKRFVRETINLVDKVGLLGIDTIKSWILKGILIIYKVDYRPFDTKEAAIKFLLEK